MQELCLGGTLAGLMEGGWLSTATGGLHVPRVMAILRHVASGMVHLHRLRLVNGDLDPSHVLLQLAEATEQQQADASRNAPWSPLAREAAHALPTGGCKAKLSNFGWTCLPTGGCIMPTGSGHGALPLWPPVERRGSRNVCGRCAVGSGAAAWSCRPCCVASCGALRHSVVLLALARRPRVETGGKRRPALTLACMQGRMHTGRQSATAPSSRARRRRSTRSAR